MKHVGEAVRDYTIANCNKKPLTAIGIVTWGCISNREVLVSRKVSVVDAYIGLLVYIENISYTMLMLLACCFCI